MSEMLKPCPFCGGKARLLTGRVAEDAEMANVECLHCLVRTDCFEDAYAPTADAAAAWNRRVPFEALMKALEDGREALKAMLSHSCVADSAPEDKFAEDHDAERSARRAITDIDAALSLSRSEA